MKVAGTVDSSPPPGNLRLLMPRTIQAELLDSLPPQHPDALHNRRDLRLTNRLMGNHRWIEQTLAARTSPAERILEIGAGEGEQARRLWARGFRVDALDLWPRPADWPAALAWHQADLQRFTAYERYRIIVGNLIFHQFTNDQLAALGAKLRSSARMIVACEPVRRRFSQLGYGVLGRLCGVNRVSLHDAHVSIAGGFQADELPRALGLDPADWEIGCATTLRGAYHLVANRRRT